MSHDPAPSQEPESSHSEKYGTALAVAQFVLTGTVLCVLAVLAYIAGTHSAKGGGEGGAQTQAAATVDVATLIQHTPEQIAKGKTLFAVNCASCHGPLGKGDGPASTALNPKPRDFTSGYWRYGGGEARVVETITQGSPGTAMASFSSLPIEDRFALAHYVRSLGPKLEPDKPEDLAWLGPTGGTGGATAAGGAAGGPAGGPTAPTPIIPIEKAMLAIEVSATPPGVALADIEPDAATDLYAARCASCHGPSGEGGIPTRMLGSNPYGRVVTRSFGAPGASWADDSSLFERIVLQGSPGYVMPASGDLSKSQVRDLYLHVLKLRARQETAGRAGS
jgi:mono/diheme cytochrome c family protein